MTNTQELRYRTAIMRCIKARPGTSGLSEEVILESLADFHFDERDAGLLTTTLLQMQADGHIFSTPNPLKKSVLNWHLSDTGKELLKAAGF